MADSGVLGFVDGALGSAETMRRLTWMATRGAEGVATSDSLKVLATSPASNKIVVNTGSAVMLNRYVDASAAQSYVVPIPSAPTLSVQPNTGGATIVRQLWVRGRDPQYAGGGVIDPTYADTYVDFYWNKVGDANPTGPRLLLAQITMPMLTATITQDMITDVRALVSPRFSNPTEANFVTSGQTVTASTGVRWPDYQPDILVPDWATDVVVETYLSNISQTTDACSGVFTSVFGPAGPNQFRAANITYNFPASQVGMSRFMEVTGKGKIPTALRGTVCTFATEATRSGGTGALSTVVSSHVTYDVKFYEKPS